MVSWTRTTLYIVPCTAAVLWEGLLTQELSLHVFHTLGFNSFSTNVRIYTHDIPYATTYLMQAVYIESSSLPYYFSLSLSLSLSISSPYLDKFSSPQSRVTRRRHTRIPPGPPPRPPWQLRPPWSQNVRRPWQPLKSMEQQNSELSLLRECFFAYSPSVLTT